MGFFGKLNTLADRLVFHLQLESKPFAGSWCSAKDISFTSNALLAAGPRLFDVCLRSGARLTGRADRARLGLRAGRFCP